MLLTDLVDNLLLHANSVVSFFDSSGWQTKTFRDVRTDVAATAARLQERGLTPGSHVGVLSDNTYSWLVHDLALVELGCQVTALTPAVIDRGIDELVATHDLDLILSIGAAAETDPSLRGAPWTAKASANAPITCRPRDPSAPPRDPSRPFRVFSSGSTGDPRCILVSRLGLEAAIAALHSDYEVTPRDTVLLFLPVANLQQRLITYAALAGGVSLVIADPLRVFPALKMGRPSLLLAPPVFYDALLRRVLSGRRGELVSGLLRWASADCADPPVSDSALAPTSPGTQLSSGTNIHPRPDARQGTWFARALAASARIALALLGRAVLRELGGRLRIMVTGMAPVSSHTLRSLVALGLPIHEAYGMTEVGIISCNTSRARRLGSVGKPATGIGLEVAADGELVVSSAAPLTFGYYGTAKDADPETYRSDGRIGTGDVGYIDVDGYVYLKGRKKNIIVTGDGRKLHPETLEKEILSHPNVTHCGILQSTSGNLVCVLHLRSDAPGARAEARSHVERCVGEFAGGQPLQSLVFVPEEFSAKNGLLTANLKVNRPGLRSYAEERATSLAAE